MKASRFLGLSVLALALAGCSSLTDKPAQPAAQPAQQPAAQPAQQQPAAQPASVEVHFASIKAIKGYRPVQISEQQTIFVNPEPAVTRADLVSIDSVSDDQQRVFIKVGVNPKGVSVLNKVPKDAGFATVVGGQLVSIQGFVQGADYFFQVRDVEVSRAIMNLIIGGQQ